MYLSWSIAFTSPEPLPRQPREHQVRVELPVSVRLSRSLLPRFADSEMMRSVTPRLCAAVSFARRVELLNQYMPMYSVELGAARSIRSPTEVLIEESYVVGVG